MVIFGASCTRGNSGTRGSNLNVQAQHRFDFDAVKKQAGEQFWNWAKEIS